MARAAVQSIRPVVITVGLLLVLSFLPRRALWWVGDIAAIVSLPMAPIADLGNDVRIWLRPGSDPLRGAPEEIELLVAERDRLRELWSAERLRVDQLLTQLEDFRLAEQFDRGSSFDPIRADVIGRGPEGLRGAVRINVGSRSGVKPGDVAVFRGAHLVGRVAQEVGALTSLLVPSNDPSVGRLHAALMPDPEPGNASPAPLRLLLTPALDGSFAADCDRSWRVAPGDSVVLDDPAWPESSRGMIVGEIAEVEPRDDQPLRLRLRVVPVYALHELRTIVIKVEPRRTGDGDGDANWEEGDS